MLTRERAIEILANSNSPIDAIMRGVATVEEVEELVNFLETAPRHEAEALFNEAIARMEQGF